MKIALGIKNLRRLLTGAVGPTPVNSVAPVLSGTLNQGDTLTTTNGTWSNTPTSYSYQLYSNPTNSYTGATLVSGANASTFVNNPAVGGLYVFERVTASNANGSNSANSNILGPIADGSALDAALSTPFLILTASNADGSAPTIDVALQPDYAVGDTVRIYRRDKAGSLIQTYSHTITSAESTDTSAGTSGKATFGLSTVPVGTWRFTCDVLKNGGATYGPLSPVLIEGPDDIEPVLTAPATPSGVASTQMIVGATTDTAEGTFYAVLTTANTAPTAVQVEAGQNAASSTTPSANVAVTSVGAKTVTVSGLTASTTYYIWYMHKDVAGNRSTVLSGGSQATAAAGFFAKLAIGSGSTGAGANRSQYINSTDGYTATGNADTSAPNLIKSADVPPAKLKFEVTLNAWAASSRIHMGVTDSTRDVGPAIFTMPGSSGNGAGITFWLQPSSQTFSYVLNGAASAQLTMTDQAVVGSIFSIEVDTTTGAVTVKHKPPAGSVQSLTPFTMSAQVPTNYQAFVGSYKSGDSCTVNFGASTWAITPTAGYSGW